MRLIDADALLDAMDEVPKPNGDFTKDGFALVTDLDSAWLKGMVDAMACVELEPTVDAEPIVRCKDCLWGRKTCGNVECQVDPNAPPEYHGYNWFCPNGER